MKNTFTEKQIKQFVKVFKKTGKLPTKKIPCTVTGEMITIFGDNLKRRVEAYGGIENLLRTFVSRAGAKTTAPAKEVTKAPAVMTRETAQEYAAFYEKNGKLPVKQIPCTVTGTMITIFGDNLKRRIKAYGGVEDLLMNFVCRAASPKKEKKTSSTRDYAQKKAELENIVYDIPKVNLNRPKTVIDLVENPEACAKYTADSCYRPDIFLNNGKACNGCQLYKNCAYAGKKLKAEKARK